MGIHRVEGRFVVAASLCTIACILTMLQGWCCDGNKATTTATSAGQASTGIATPSSLEESVSGECRFVLVHVVGRDLLYPGTRSEQQSYRIQVIRVLRGRPLSGEVLVHRYSHDESFSMESGATYLLAMRDGPGAQSSFWLTYVDGAPVPTGTEDDRVNDLMRRIEAILSGKRGHKSHGPQPTSKPISRPATYEPTRRGSGVARREGWRTESTTIRGRHASMWWLLEGSLTGR
jgi:hypothetical protein